MEAIILKALKELPEVVPEEMPEEDWVHRFFGDCEDVGDEEMQSLWAQILAGEVAQPGTFSKRTLGFVKQLSKKEAEKITQFFAHIWLVGDPKEPREGAYFCDEIILLNAPTKRDHNDPYVPYILRCDMTALGLSTMETVHFQQLPWKPAELKGKRAFLEFHGRLYVIENCGRMGADGIPADTLTSLGKELFGACCPDPSWEYMEACVHQYRLKDMDAPTPGEA